MQIICYYERDMWTHNGLHNAFLQENFEFCSQKWLQNEQSFLLGLSYLVEILIKSSGSAAYSRTTISEKKNSGLSLESHVLTQVPFC